MNFLWPTFLANIGPTVFFCDTYIEKALDIIKNHKPKPLPEDVKKSLDSIFEEAEALSKERKAKEAS